MRKAQTNHQWLRQQLKGLSDDPAAESACLLWPFAQKGRNYKLGNGYGAVYHKRKLLSVSREAWRLINGPIPEGMHVLHRCNVPRCFRPSHLFLGTTLDKLRDSVQPISEFGAVGFFPQGTQSSP